VAVTAGCAYLDKIVADLAVAVALGGDCLADAAMLRAEPALFGPVASAPVPRAGTRPLAVSAAWGTSFGWPDQHPASTSGVTGSHVPCQCLNRARATFTPVTTWPVSRHPPGSSLGNDWTLV